MRVGVRASACGGEEECATADVAVACVCALAPHLVRVHVVDGESELRHPDAHEALVEVFAAVALEQLVERAAVHVLGQDVERRRRGATHEAARCFPRGERLVHRQPRRLVALVPRAERGAATAGGDPTAEAAHDVRVLEQLQRAHLLESVVHLRLVEAVERHVLHDDLLSGAAVLHEDRLAVDAAHRRGEEGLCAQARPRRRAGPGMQVCARNPQRNTPNGNLRLGRSSAWRVRQRAVCALRGEALTRARAGRVRRSWPSLRPLACGERSVRLRPQMSREAWLQACRAFWHGLPNLAARSSLHRLP